MHTLTAHKHVLGIIVYIWFATRCCSNHRQVKQSRCNRYVGGFGSNLEMICGGLVGGGGGRWWASRSSNNGL